MATKSDTTAAAPVNQVNPSHLRPEPFFVAGKERGLHYGERIGGVDGYCVSVDLLTPLPLLHVRRRTIGRDRSDDDDVEHTNRGVAQRLTAAGHPQLDATFVAKSPGDGFPAALARAPGVAAALAAAAADLEMLDIGPLGQTSRLVLRSTGDPAALIALAESLAAAADDIGARGVVFPDATLARIGVRSDAEPSPEVIEALAKNLMDVTHWLAGHAARVGDAVEAHVTLEDAGLELAGVLRLSWRDPSATIVDASLDAALPQLESGLLSLEPQKGPWARIRALRDEHIGDADVDSAYLIDGDTRQFAVIRATRAIVVELAPALARIEIDGDRLRVMVPPAPRSPAEVHRLGQLLTLLWRRAAIIRAGHAIVETPEFDSSA